MLLDNENKNKKVHEWIEEYTTNGKMSVVSGYFTVGAMAWLSKNINDNISEFKFILGEMVDWSGHENDALDLLNEELSIEGAFQLNVLAQKAVDFLKLEKVEIKTLEPNFCHAKLFIFNHFENKTNNNYFITGSSNITESGLGLKTTSNVELNHADFGAGNYSEYLDWFNDLWKDEKAHSKKTIIHEDGRKEKKDFKTYLIEQIELIFSAYSPKDIYFKILFELYGGDLLLDENDAEFSKKMGRLENTIIYKNLYEFQQKGVKSLIKMMDKFGGAILADAVGLGKTWTALAVIKHYEFEGYQSLIICPKKLEQNWSKFFEKDNLFYRDDFEFAMRFHTDLQYDRWENPKYKGKDKFDIHTFCNSKPLVLVIDESHNLRNNKSERYKWFVEELLAKTKGKLKVLLLSATPINNSLWDLRNQFRLLVKDNDYGLKETDLEIGSIDYVFRRSREAMRIWQSEGAHRIGGLIDLLPREFMRLTDALLVSRNRKWVSNIEKKLHFPVKEKPDNIFVTPKNFGTFESFEELFE
ncbi:MAG: SNF2-related protein, partial [Bacteroidales bacterium]|nr:SNF2-related protein [Bacteroidales bacterium]